MIGPPIGYILIGQMIVTGVFPLIILTFLNCYILRKIQKYRTIALNDESNSGADNRRADDVGQSVILLVLVIFFVICHFMRVLFYLHEIIYFEYFQENFNRGCFQTPIWILYSRSISALLIRINSAANFFIYIFVSKKFRRVFFRCFKRENTFEEEENQVEMQTLVTSN